MYLAGDNYSKRVREALTIKLHSLLRSHDEATGA